MLNNFEYLFNYSLSKWTNIDIIEFIKINSDLNDSI